MALKTFPIERQRKLEEKLVRRLVEGTAAWLTFKQATSARTLYSEHFLYPPLFEIGFGRGWKAVAQVPVTKATPTAGAPKTLDFVFFKNSKSSTAAVMIEVKFLRGTNTSQELAALYYDFKKLRDVSIKKIDNATLNTLECAPGKWQIIVAQRDVYEKILKSNSVRREDVASMLRRAREGTLTSAYKSVIETKLKKEFHWHVFAIGEDDWPK
ncbi:hypothetical protein [Gluconobacter kanchanaburiensis]|uniref:Uncharacterized protein n=1 Tax=Gluconobacter kanchanaburiensis NBRC 103587 TaxID=1307948 RepID=A0A511BB33_9PROT|nr:hypothetical protein [Gluconobacter kanchanaburiensis]MBF0862743.1 hypothetical protein [Gluconobacter kanchanaburiensis]GBR69199.1 hypothetical protein AA103587_1192 [Gluconobacter kanchanaburiensis NBRC 103587]GEK97001.1 hypothetical protein GKA01_21980 [Gluconobacter kanchanaburiensis NBRC 103587]